MNNSANNPENRTTVTQNTEEENGETQQGKQLCNSTSLEKTELSLFELSFQQAEKSIKESATKLRHHINDKEKELLEELQRIGQRYRPNTNLLVNKNNPSIQISDKKEFVSKIDNENGVANLNTNIESLRGDNEKEHGNTFGNENIRINFIENSDIKSFLQGFTSIGSILVKDISTDGVSSWGVTVTSKNEIVLADCRNKIVKKFTNSGEIIDQIQISENPFDLTLCLRDNIAITLSKQQIFILDVSTTIELREKIKTLKQYEGIAYSTKRQFIVGCLSENCVDVISTKGDLLKSFSGKTSGGVCIFDQPRYVDVNTVGHILISDSGNNCISCISEDGQVQFKYKPEEPMEISHAQGVVSDVNGSIFVADFGHNRIHLLTQAGNFQRFAVAEEMQLTRPVAVSMTTNNKLVIVQSDGMVKVFGLETPNEKSGLVCWCPRCFNDEAENSETTCLHRNKYNLSRFLR